MTEHVTRKEITFDCGHTWWFKSPYPKKGETLWCMKCRKERVVVSGEHDWHIRCTGCLYNRGFGAAKTNAEIAIGRHRRKNPTHVMKLFNGKSLERIFNGGLPEPLPGVTDDVTDSDDKIPF